MTREASRFCKLPSAWALYPRSKRCRLDIVSCFMPENLSRPKEILLVEDYEDDAENLKRVLAQIGVSNPLRWLKDGATAKSHLGSIQSQADAPAILLLDIKLPFFSGFEILRSIRENPVFERTL